MKPNLEAEVVDKADTLYGAYFKEIATETAVDRQFLAIAERIEQRIVKLLLKAGAVLTSMKHAEELDTLVADLNAATRRLAWLVHGPDAPGPKMQRGLIEKLAEFDFTLDFGRTLRPGAECNRRILEKKDPENDLVDFMRMRDIKAQLEAKLSGRAAPVKFARAYREFCIAVELLTVIFGKEGGESAAIPA